MAHKMVILAMFSISLFDFSSAATIRGNGTIHELVFIGSVEGKSFFSESALTRNWNEAREFCNASNLELAAIETRAQAELLRSKIGFPGFSGLYWTAARDAHLSRQFSWDTTNAQPLENLGLDWVPNFSQRYESCVEIQAEGTLFRMIILPCSNKRNTLCQTSPTISSSNII